jgi:hypothetical protein
MRVYKRVRIHRALASGNKACVLVNLTVPADRAPCERISDQCRPTQVIRSRCKDHRLFGMCVTPHVITDYAY